MLVQQDHYKKSYYETPFHSRTSELNILNEWQRWKDYTVATNYFRTDLEYFAVRNTTGVIDYTPMVKQKITGPDSAEFVNRFFTRDMNKISIGRVGYVVWCDEQGQVLDDGTVVETTVPNWWEVPIHERYELDLYTPGQERSILPINGTLGVRTYTEHFIEVELPPSEDDVGFPEPDVMHVALWLPDVAEGVQVPVIMTIHPYYDFGGEGVAGDDSNPNTIPDAGVGAWVLDQFVPHGYALAQVSTFGTGKSTHCQDVKGLGEQIGIQAAVHWLGEQNWSNGNVGLMGKSYAGTTNWEAAQNPSPHLKTIVPISGSIGVQQMFYRNGSSEARAMLYDVLYEGATADATEDDMRMCSDDAIGPVSPFTTWLGAGFGGDQWNDYWDERYHLQDVLDNYNGSVYIVWGMQDWNVDPYHAFPTHELLRQQGINVRTIAGQWAHNYPDQPDRHSEVTSGYGAEAYPNMTRFDWAVELFPWFEYYLKGIGDAVSYTHLTLPTKRIV